MTSFYYYDQNPSEFRFLVQIRKSEKYSGRSSKWRHRANGLFYKNINILLITSSFLDLISKQARPGAAVSAFLLKQKFTH